MTNWHSNNRERSREQSRASMRKRRQYQRQLLDKAKDQPCQDCGFRYPSYVMDFDHRVKQNKLFNLGAASGAWVADERLLAEIAKCDVVCANCHRERTYGPVTLREVV